MPFRQLRSVVLDCPDAVVLGTFYAKLLEWDVAESDGDWMRISDPSGSMNLSFQSEPDFVPPVWPQTAEGMRMQMHLDVHVDDLETAGATAAELGATLAPVQFQDLVRVWLDPAGHPFCLFVDGG